MKTGITVRWIKNKQGSTWGAGEDRTVNAYSKTTKERSHHYQVDQKINTF
jgi:hypothetical protein